MTCVKAHCDDCQEAQTIVPTGKKKVDGYSAEWWEFIAHWSKKTGQPCPGAGKQV